jgi:spoIIIJ-associated protein
VDSESLEVNAKTVEDAIAKATQLTGRPRDDLEITIISEGRGGILGIGAEDAHILVSVKAPPAPPAATPAPEPRAEPRAERSSADEIEEAAATASGESGRRPSAPITEEVASEARNVLLDLLDLLGMDTDVEIQRRDGTLVLEVIGEDLGLLIGRRGETLTALQFTLNLILAKRLKKWARVVVDVEGYRGRREQTLSGLARRVASQVQQTGQAIALEAMPAGERRIIHMALADNPGVTTGSVGEGDHRKVVISPKR